MGGIDKGESRGFRGKVGNVWPMEFFFLIDNGSTVLRSPLGAVAIDGGMEGMRRMSSGGSKATHFRGDQSGGKEYEVRAEVVEDGQGELE